MPGFPQLTKADLANVYDYIRQETGPGLASISGYEDQLCLDSCWRYDSLLMSLQYMEDAKIRAALIKDNGDRINWNVKSTSLNVLTDSGDVVSIPPAPDKVNPVTYPSIYYKFTIETFNWYNIDHLFQFTSEESELKVQFTGEYKKDNSVFIVVPEYRVFYEGGPLDDSDFYGFLTPDGKLPLPAGTEVIVFSVGEEKGELLFDYKKFTASSKQTIELKPAPVSKRTFNQIVKGFRLKDVSVKAKDSKNAKEIRQLDKKMEKKLKMLEPYRPKNCSCRCEEKMDSTAQPVIIIADK
jgi:hypothetical protein